MRKENLTQDEYLASIYESMLNGDTESPKKVITESNKPVVIDPNAEPTRAFNEAFDEIAMNEGWFDRFAGAAKGAAASAGTKASNLGNRIATGATNLKNTATNAASNAKTFGKNVVAAGLNKPGQDLSAAPAKQVAAQANPEEARYAAVIKQIFSAGFNNLSNDLVKSGLIEPTAVKDFNNTIRKYIKTKINSKLWADGKLDTSREVLLSDDGSVTIVDTTNPMANKKSKTRTNAAPAPQAAPQAAPTP